MLKVDETNFLLFAAKHYENTYYDTTEFYDDLKRFVYLKRLFNQYESKGTLKINLILNHMRVLYNVFGVKTTDMLFLKLESHESLLKTFLVFLQRMPEKINAIGIKNRSIISKDIPLNQHVLSELNKI